MSTIVLFPDQVSTVCVCSLQGNITVRHGLQITAYTGMSNGRWWPHGYSTRLVTSWLPVRAQLHLRSCGTSPNPLSWEWVPTRHELRSQRLSDVMLTTSPPRVPNFENSMCWSWRRGDLDVFQQVTVGKTCKGVRLYVKWLTTTEPLKINYGGSDTYREGII